MVCRWLMLVCLFAFSAPAIAAPELAEDQRRQLNDLTTDGDQALDTQRGLYVLLGNAKNWKADDFTDEAGEKPRTPDYKAIRENPNDVRGGVFYIEGWVAQADRFPGNGKKLQAALDPGIGEQVTRWTVVTEKGNADATIIVLLHDPNGRIPEPKKNAKVRIAARFYKLWTTNSSEDKPFTFAVFVGGAAEVVPEQAGASGPSLTQMAVLLLVLALAAFYIVRIMAKRRGGGGGQVQERLEEIRRKREQHEAFDEDEAEEEDEEAENLPDDPVEALGVLNEKNKQD